MYHDTKILNNSYPNFLLSNYFFNDTYSGLPNKYILLNNEYININEWQPCWKPENNCGNSIIHGFENKMLYLENLKQSQKQKSPFNLNLLLSWAFGRYFFPLHKYFLGHKETLVEW